MPFKKSFMIGNRLVGENAPVLFIAEAGVAHFGDMDLARKLVLLAAEAGADVFKTQFFDVEAMISSHASEWRDRLRPRNLTFEQACELKAMCDERGLLFMATAHDETRIGWLEKLQVPAVKVGSGERNNPEFVKRLARLGKPMIISTGMYSEADVIEATEACLAAGCDRLVLLHCVTSYPTPPEEVNLAAMARLREIFPGPVGYSDHTVDGLAVLAAVARGAQVVEKHITILRDVPNAQDWKVSAGPDNLARLVADIRRLETMIGSGRKEPAGCEQAGMAWALKSLVASHALSAGHMLTEADVTAKRPGGGLLPNRLGDLIGRCLTRAYAEDEIFDLKDLAP